MIADDVRKAADICQEAFDTFNPSVGLDPEFPPHDVPFHVLGNACHPGFIGFVAINNEKQIVGSNLIDLREEVAGIGPISVTTCCHNSGVGRLLMKACMKAAAEKGIRSVRLHAIANNKKSFSLYLDLGFNPICTCGEYVGFCQLKPLEGFRAEPLSDHIVEPCNALHLRVCGFDRRKTISSMIADGPHPQAVVFDMSGKVVAYTTGTYPGGHTVADSTEALKALLIFQSRQVQEAITAGALIPPITIFVPHDYPEVMRWLACNGFRLSRQTLHMGYGHHQKPVNGVYLSSINY